jgi:hypothetical protein
MVPGFDRAMQVLAVGALRSPTLKFACSWWLWIGISLMPRVTLVSPNVSPTAYGVRLPGAGPGVAPTGALPTRFGSAKLLVPSPP